ncbi:MAG: DUF1232 domain-containing protein [Treponema sp.]|nr:DUF1232 domain-containing protein [Treponema sp.]
MSESYEESLEEQEIEFSSEKKVSDAELVENYQKHFDKDIAMKLLVKLRKSTRDKPKVIAGAAGAIVVTLGKLLSALENPATPTHMKALIVGAIGYILLPLDLIPDFTPVIGYGDDLASASGVVTAVAIYSDFTLEKLDAYIDGMDSKS